MARSPLILAALAKAAKADLSLARAVTLTAESNGFYDAALVTDTSGENVVVRMPTQAKALARLQTELQALKALRPVADRLPFDLPRFLGATKDIQGVPAVVLSYVYGVPSELGNRSGTDALAVSIGQAIAALHSLPTAIVEQAGLPVYSVSDVVKNKVNLLDRGAATGLIPSFLLNRWEAALEDVNLFRFTPTVIHADLVPDTVLTENDVVSGIISWEHFQIGDPAEDLAWISLFAGPDFSYSAFQSYNAARTSDTNLAQRAEIYSEMAWVRWLLLALADNDQSSVEMYRENLERISTQLEEAESFELEPTPLAADFALDQGNRMTNDDFVLDTSREVAFDAYPNSDAGLPMPSFDTPERGSFLDGVDLGAIADESAPTRPMPIISESTAETAAQVAAQETGEGAGEATSEIQSREKDELF